MGTYTNTNMNLNYLWHAKCSESSGNCLVAKKKKKKAKRSKCKMLVQIQAVRIYAIMCFNGKIWSDEGKFKLSKFESRQFHWIIINLFLVACSSTDLLFSQKGPESNWRPCHKSFLLEYNYFHFYYLYMIL